MFEIRPAQSQDARTLAAFAARSFRETYERDNTPEDMDLYIAANFSEDKQLREINDPSFATVLAFTQGEIIGYYQLLTGKTESCVTGPRPVELFRIYVDARWHGKQVGPHLLEHAFDFALRKGFQTIWLGVWEKNLRAQAFYRKCGFTAVGTHLFQVGNDPQNDLILSRPL